MHDWVFNSIEVNWHSGLSLIGVTDRKSINREIIIHEIIYFSMSRRFEWGESTNINRISLEEKGGGEGHNLVIEMQSGDTIEIIANKICLPCC